MKNCFKISVRNDTYNFTELDKIRSTDTTETKLPNLGSDLLQKWNFECNNKNNDSKVGNFTKLTISNNPTGYSRKTNLPPVSSAFMYIEPSSNNHGLEGVIVSWERTDVIQISKITFYYNRF